MTQHKPIKHNDLIFDLGMHQGEDTDFYLAKGFRVVAFEADPDLIKNCREQFSEQLTSGQLEIVEGAIVDSPAEGDTITFYKNSNVTVWGTIDPVWKDRNERAGWESEQITVPTVDFGKCIEKYGVPYYMKIDIEGADILSLKKLGDYEVKPDYVSIESNKLSLSAIDDELNILEALGYDSFKAAQQAMIPGTLAPRPAKEGRDIKYRHARDASGPFGRELPGKWQSRSAIKNTYRRIFIGYRVFGNDTFMRTNRFARRIWQLLQRIMGRPIPGWFDTHARHSTADKSS
ncbi:MAG: FkbM family methyltransferase [Gammaproteobacteria bacterium]|nr:FkbM family methyltransferase [Gammaproteobacteria bacterium]MCP4088739.1 FkbM family methyltransferase [Gammaproteobacteria bacterium]MCP4275218.1 FkbM family methyltransferase [Gammaproteobacteria bacterium]MCP4830772.1 FkbM family methyltransferase [Gammaproteobacteria bacterium]MCP4929561.1 FkbM family methyltransferase [Gammaproteobacteria bacterium]